MGLIERLQAFGRMRERVRVVRARALEVFAETDQAEQFLEAGNVHLDGRAPILVAMDNEDGYLKVMTILDIVQPEENNDA